MKLSMRLKYMGAEFIELLVVIGSFLLKVGIPVVAVLGLIAIMCHFPWWVSVIVIGGAALLIYLWFAANVRYKKDYETSKDVLSDKYQEITRIWFNMMNEGKSCRTVYGLMTPLIDEYDGLLEYHKKLYGEDDVYKLYVDRVDTFIECCENDEKAKQKEQEERAAALKAMGGNGEIVEKGELI